MKLLNLSVALLLGFARPAFADRGDFNQIPDSVKTALVNAATSLGYDLSTDAGRKSFGDYLKSQKDALATSQGFDMTTEEGRKAMHDYVKTQVDSIAAAQGFDMTTKEGRDALQAYLVSQGNYALLAPPGRPRDNQGGQNQAGGPQRPPREGQDGQPPCARDQFNNAGSANSNAGTTSGSSTSTVSDASAKALAQGQAQMGPARPASNNGGRRY